MNFKKTHILLMIMSLFLLISIGSVCAESITADSNVLTATDEATDIIAENDAGTTQELINTTVTTDKDIYKIGENEDKNIAVAVKDNESKTLDELKESNFTVFEGSKSLNFIYNNSIIRITDSLSVGNHSIILNYLGNNVYSNSTTKFILGIYGNKTLEQPITPVISNGTTVKIPIVITDGVDAFDFTTDDLTLNLTYLNADGNKTSKIIDYTVEQRTIKFILDNTQFVSANVNITYTGGDKSSKIVNIKLGTKITAENITARDNETKNITIAVNSFDKINVTANELKVFEGEKALEFKYANDTITITSSLAKGKHDITIKYLGDVTFGESTKDIVVSIYGNKTMQLPQSVNVNSTKKGELKINITDGINLTDFTKEDISINAFYKNGNDTVEIQSTILKVENGVITFELENGNFTTATLNITYIPLGLVGNVTLKRIYNVNILPINTVADYGDGNFTFQLVDIDDKNIILANKTVKFTGKNSAGSALYFIKSSGSSYTINQEVSVTSDEKGIVCLENKDFYPGLAISTVIYAPANKYTMTITGSGDDLKGTNTTTVTINKADVIVKLEKYNEYYGSKKNITITVTNAKTGKGVANVYILLNITGATLSVPNQITNEKGQIHLGVNGLPVGTYNVQMNTNDTNLINTSNSSSFTVKRIPVSISTKNVQIYYNSGTTTTITLKDRTTNKALSNAYVALKIDKTIYYGISNNKGVIQASVPLNVGNHKITVTDVYMIDNTTIRDVYQYTAVTRNIKVIKASAKFTAPAITTYYKNNRYFMIKLTNTKNKQPIHNALIYYKVYTSKGSSVGKAKTASDGILRLTVDTLSPGTYKVLIYTPSNKNYAAKQIASKIVIKKAPTKLIPVQVTAKKGTNAYFKVTAKNTKTNKVITGIKLKIKVFTGKKYKIYTVKTNSKGIANLNVKSLSVGTHRAVVLSGNSYCVAKAASSYIKIT